MRSTRRILAFAALALGTTLAACSDTATAPDREQSDNPLVQALNRLSGGQGQILSVEKKDVGTPGGPGGRVRQLQAIQPCYIDEPCEREPIDPNCYSGCSWFDVGAGISTGYYGGIKTVTLTGSLYAYSNAASADTYIDFFSAGGCVSNPSHFDSAYLTGSNGPFTLSASRYVEYTGGSFTWRVSSDGHAVNRYNRHGYEYTSYSLCY